MHLPRFLRTLLGCKKILHIYAPFWSLFLKFCSQWVSHFSHFQVLAGVGGMRVVSLYFSTIDNTPGPGFYLPVETPSCFVLGECMLTFPREHSTFHTELLLQPKPGLHQLHGPLPVYSLTFLAGS